MPVVRAAGHYPIHGRNDVGVRLAIYDDENRRLAVREAGIAQVLDRIDDFSDIDRRTAAPFR